MFYVPEFGAVATGEASREQLGPHGAIEEKHTTFIEERMQQISGSIHASQYGDTQSGHDAQIARKVAPLGLGGDYWGPGWCHQVPEFAQVASSNEDSPASDRGPTVSST